MIDTWVLCIHRLQANLAPPMTGLPAAWPWTFPYISVLHPYPTPHTLPVPLDIPHLSRSSTSPVVYAGSQESHAVTYMPEQEWVLPETSPGVKEAFSGLSLDSERVQKMP